VLDLPPDARSAAAISPQAAWRDVARLLADQLQPLLRAGSRQPVAGVLTGHTTADWSD